jgi:hypothetical protein
MVADLELHELMASPAVATPAGRGPSPLSRRRPGEGAGSGRPSTRRRLDTSLGDWGLVDSDSGAGGG